MAKSRWKIIIAERELTQKKIADDLGMTEPRLSNIVKGKFSPNLDEYYRLAKYLDVDMEDCYIWEE